MKGRRSLAAAAILCCTLTVSGCGIIRTANTIGSLFGLRKKTSTVASVVKIIGSVLGQFYNTTTKNALVGTWTYEEPAIQFESENLLSKAGGAVASQAVADNLVPYYEKLGFKTGKISLDLREDNTCTYTIGGKTYQGTYDFDDSSKKLTLKTALFPLPAAYLSIVNNQMAMTFESSKLLTLVQAAGLVSNQSSVTAVSNLANTYDGMKTGFTFTRKK